MKIYNEHKNVYQAACERFDYVYSHFDKVYVSFSGGKDSGVMLNMAIDAARKHNKLPVTTLIIDLEGQYAHTIDFISRMVSREEVTAYWVCLPIHLRNAVSQYQTHWLCWDPDKQDTWIRDYPDSPYVIKDENYFPFFRKGMEFEEFVPLFGEWFANGEDTACMVGIRSDESLNRYRTIASDNKGTYMERPYSTQIADHLYNFYPLYDFRTEDIWIANGKQKYDYNKIYDLMHLAGVGIHQQRLCQPFGDDQRKGLYLFKILEPETWAKLVSRVEGANFGNRYSDNNQTALGYHRFTLPAGHTYESYAKFLLDTMPPHLKEHYMTKINTFLKWWDKQGISPIPDTADPKQEAAKKAPSWRRICKTLIKNDYWCAGLSFSQTKRDMERMRNLIEKYTEL